MQMFHEKTFEVQILTGGRTYDARLYVRLNADAKIGVLAVDTAAPNSSMVLHFPIVDNEDYPWAPSTLGVVFAYFLFPRLPADATIVLEHLPRFRISGVPYELATVREAMSTGLPEDCRTVRFELTLEAAYELTGSKSGWSAANDDDIYAALRDLFKKEGVTLDTCAFCRFADAPHFGGADWRFGLYCFRDAPEQMDLMLREPSWEVWNTVAWSHVDAFHTCPSFELDKSWVDS